MPYTSLKEQIKVGLEDWKKCIYPNKHTWTKNDYVNFFDLLTFNYIRYEAGLYYLNKEVIKSKGLNDLLKYLSNESVYCFNSINEE